MHPPMPPLQMRVAPPAPPGPPPDIWSQFAANLSQGIATAAAALNLLQSTTRGLLAYEEGGKPYDNFQLAVLRGFSHTDKITQIPRIWPYFQQSKHMDTHKDNIRRQMVEWATNQRIQVGIDRSMVITNSTLREILSLNFNPDGSTAEVDTCDKGLSILVCRARSTEGKSAIRRREAAEEKSRGNWTLADAEREQPDDFSTPLCPEDYNELLRCLGSYCALLHALFGDRCAFFKQCFRLWQTMDSEHVYDRRRYFTPLLCRQIVWAIIEDGRSYFSQRLNQDDFIGVHPDDIKYPRCSVIEIEPNIRHQVPLVRASFPPSWMISSKKKDSTTSGTVPPVQGLMVTTPSVISAVTLGSGTGQSQGTRPPGQIRTTNIHPTIKTTMEPYIKKFQNVHLNKLLTFCRLTIDDLPTLPPTVSTGSGGICYNFILGKCTHAGCQHKDGHINASDISDDFAAELLTKLRPGITEFLANGAPRYRKRKRQQRE